MSKPIAVIRDTENKSSFNNLYHCPGGEIGRHASFRDKCSKIATN